MILFGIKFAPLLVPLERRLQTFAAAMWIIVLAFGGMVGAWGSIYLLLYTRYYPLVLLYYAWIYLDRNTCETGGRRSEWMRNWAWWRYYRDYFPVSLIKTADLPATHNYLFCIYPHGILSSGAFCNFASNATNFRSVFPGLVSDVLTLSSHFWMPFSRELMHGLGALSASGESITHVLTHSKGGRVLCLMVGGARESFKCKPGLYEIILKSRKGFVRIALKTGTPLVPVFTFGETDLFDQVPNPPGSWLLRLQEQIRRVVGVAPCIPIGRGFFQYSFGLIPRRHKLYTVVGAPIEVPKVSVPSQELIDEYHRKFTDSLIQLFEDHKDKYVDNPKTTKLVIE
uniref:Acyltransferase n=1 Tax=Cacopsylla melanoneura TaxID=428564 RepID=A0A8D8VH82_9HEMI